ncbi:aromatic ring-hydroxylating dioxygenase subunit alpha, partial [Salmonella enterica subsp. enterica]|nr:aromatic ring-hydroxylating dioxygenase subunit alpha [Salmonella enterica subsp. enterica]
MAETMTAKLLDFPRNAWYVAAWDHEVGRKGILSRTIAGRPLA